MPDLSPSTPKLTKRSGSVTFYECEHDGDLSEYTDALTNAGAEIVDTEVNEDAEEGVVTINVHDWDQFIEAFRMTSAYKMSSLCKN